MLAAEYYRVLKGIAWYYRVVLTSIAWFYRVLQDIAEYKQGIAGYYRVVQGITGYCRLVLTGNVSCRTLLPASLSN